MADPSLDLQKAIVATLKGNAPVASLIGARIYDHVPDKASYPYVTYGADQSLQDDADCVAGFEVFVTIDVWSAGVGQPEMKRIAGAVRAALHNAELALDEHSLVLIEHRQTRYLDDPDKQLRHGVVEFRALVEG